MPHSNASARNFDCHGPLATHSYGALDPEGRPLEPLQLVDLTPGTGHLEPAAIGSPLLPTVVRVGVLRGSPTTRDLPAISQLDVTLVEADRSTEVPVTCVRVVDLEDAVHRIATAIARCPITALSLVHVLRATEHACVDDALLTESFAYSTLLGSSEFAAWLSARPPAPVRPGQPTGRPVLLHKNGTCLELTLNRPGTRNSFSRAMRDGLLEAFDLVEADSTIERVHIDGRGAAFCSGGDLAEFGTSSDLGVAHLIRSVHSVGRTVHQWRGKTEFALHGACIGAGIEIPAFADLVTAAPGTWFLLPELSMGLIPGAGGTVSIPRRIGRWRTAYLVLTGERLDVDTALEWGLVDAISEPPTATQ